MSSGARGARTSVRSNVGVTAIPGFVVWPLERERSAGLKSALRQELALNPTHGVLISLL